MLRALMHAAPRPAISPSNAAHASLGPLVATRAASHASQGTANRARRGAGPRLGLKKGASAPVVPGNIIFRQRGSLWHAGENCVRGRDHTISALAAGYVRYYRDPARHPTRKYIGVVFEQDEQLPRGPGAARRRRLGLTAVPMADESTEAESTAPAVEPLVRSWAERVPNSQLGTARFVRLMEKFKNERRAWKRLRKLRKRGDGLSTLKAREQDATRRRRKA